MSSYILAVSGTLPLQPNVAGVSADEGECSGRTNTTERPISFIGAPSFTLRTQNDTQINHEALEPGVKKKKKKKKKRRRKKKKKKKKKKKGLSIL